MTTSGTCIVNAELNQRSQPYWILQLENSSQTILLLVTLRISLFNDLHWQRALKMSKTFYGNVIRIYFSDFHILPTQALPKKKSMTLNDS